MNDSNYNSMKNKDREDNIMENEEITVTTESNEIVETTAAQDSTPNTEIAPISPEDCMPADEKAVSIDWNALHVDAVGKVVDSFMPEDERALQETPEESVKLIQHQRLSATAGMGHIRGVLEDRLFAQILVDEKKERKFVFCVDQKDGVPCRFELSQAVLFRLSRVNYDVDRLNAYEQKKIRDKLFDLEDSILNSWQDGNRPIQLVDVMEALFRSRKQLPEITRIPVDNRREIYEKIKQSLSSLGNCFVEKTTYYAFYPDCIRVLANKLGMKERELLRKLNDLNLLYLQPSCEGFQARVRIYDCCVRMVYIYRLDKIPREAGGYAEEAKADEEQAQALFENL